MGKISIRLIMACILVSLCLSGTITAFASDKVYKVGFIEAGEYWTYTESYKAIKKILIQKGWGDKVEYPMDAHFSPGWEKKTELQEIAKLLMARQDLDLVISAGTAATAAILKHNNKETPILSVAVADAVKSKFVVSETDSGSDNFTVRIVPGRYKRMFEIFHDVVDFQKLGIIYSDNENGRKYSNVEDAHQVAKELGFEIIEYNQIGDAESNQDCQAGIQYLIDQGIDAFFIPALNCFDWKISDVASLLELLTQNKIPSFSREGTRTVKAGALMGFSTYDFSDRGRFLGERVIKILNGTKPRELIMVDNAPPKITFNLHAASKIGFDPPIDILAASDNIFQEITLPEDRLKK
ncbi:MAG: hypothetical protein HOG03_07060 [Desulfobacula sp.]|jgi:ABC-type uncharacterized transport system substrate-binding protein|uniref:ABC transporter substrate-binding protein n=1 Tax=Desulfobacula sp. TaxID=2593537 RepID=UPI001DCD8482|nr:hypothetical protein [Desulfobacula sp.]MBT3484715.1 hypothetical protein [Desulfobacula sp.]MBT3804345.1 hypothetical protein [Desulfobacula sp.]MBT4026865.1 hypothetical protein [Desulfobacula sp.]MBT4198538.1 hypothetical protein [Desulfobacula sp.]